MGRDVGQNTQGLQCRFFKTPCVENPHFFANASINGESSVRAARMNGPWRLYAVVILQLLDEPLRGAFA